jgi:chemotaxis protein methyltransferase CheR
MSLVKKLPDDFMISTRQEIELTRHQFQFFASLMYELSGVNLPISAKNESLVKNRLSKLIRKYKLQSYDDLIEMLKNSTPQLTSEFISSLTTNKTHFFREDSHFDWLAGYLKTHFNTHEELRFWCAAASTGQEPYTTAIVMRENLTPSQLSRTKFLATDIDLQVLKKAAEGAYTPNEMDGLPDRLRTKYFDTYKDRELKYRAKDELSNMIRYAPMNLVQDHYPFQHKFHLIFCRNVLIYFDPATTKKVIENLAHSLAPGGYLILGHSESGTVKSFLIKPLNRAIYQKI